MTVYTLSPPPPTYGSNAGACKHNLHFSWWFLGKTGKHLSEIILPHEIRRLQLLTQAPNINKHSALKKKIRDLGGGARLEKQGLYKPLFHRNRAPCWTFAAMAAWTQNTLKCKQRNWWKCILTGKMSLLRDWPVINQWIIVRVAFRCSMGKAPLFGITYPPPFFFPMIHKEATTNRC